LPGRQIPKAHRKRGNQRSPLIDDRLHPDHIAAAVKGKGLLGSDVAIAELENDFCRSDGNRGRSTRLRTLRKGGVAYSTEFNLFRSPSS